VTLAYRHGYFADDPYAPAHHGEAQGGKTAEPPYSALRAAMQRGGPDPTEIIFAANVRPSTAETEPSVAPGNQAAKKTAGPYRRFTVDFRVSPKELDCAATPDGVHHCTLDFVTFVYDVDGELLNSQANGVKVTLTPAQYASTLNGRLRYRQQISVPAKKGKYYLRVGLHDEATDHVGALELPVAAVAKLPPLAVQGSAPAAP
jgi:alkanesulfonate monooxygenase SsuD/methylene tetrahydromethanopterin reductase-like flavin-dependent oxidoreductase (luciferase family)